MAAVAAAPSTRRDVAQLIAPLSTVGISITAAIVGPPTNPRMIDQAIYERTLLTMREGKGYYRATAEALSHYIGPAETLRAFRPPALFLALRALPPSAGWILFTAAAAISAFALAQAFRAPPVMPVVCAYLLYMGWRLGGTGFQSWLFAEYWALPLLGLSVLEYRRGRDRSSAALAVAAVAVRELAVVLLVGGLVSAKRHRRPLRPWLAGTAATAALGAAHFVAARGVLAPAGTGAEDHLLGTGRWWVPLHIAGFGVPVEPVAGLLLWAGALWFAAREDWGDFLGPLLLLPAAGFLVQRTYWGILTVPVELAIVTGGLSSRLLARRAEPQGEGIEGRETP